MSYEHTNLISDDGLTNALYFVKQLCFCKMIDVEKTAKDQTPEDQTQED